MKNTRNTLSIAELQRENARLKQQVTYWKKRVAEFEKKFAVTLPIAQLTFSNKPVRLIVHDGMPLVQAADVLEHVAETKKRDPNKKGLGFIDRLRSIGLGAREAIGVPSDALAERFGTTRLHLCHALGRGTRTTDLGFVTPLGIETLRERAPEFCAWVEREAFPAVIERFGKGGGQ